MANKIKLAEIPAVKKAIESEQILYATFNSAVPRKGDQGHALFIDVPIAAENMKTIPGIIAMKDVDEDTEHPNLAWLVGLRVPFIVKDVDEEHGMLICSRKDAQRKIKANMMQDLASGKIFEGRILGFTNFGCFVEVNSVVGLLRNADYSTDDSRINERYSLGDKINVKCLSVSQDDRHRIVWEAAVKYHRTTPFVCNVEPGSIVLGKVIDIKNFPRAMGVFVRLEDDDKLDVLCGMPPELEIEKDVPVVIRINAVEPGATEFARPRIRGKILRLA